MVAQIILIAAAQFMKKTGKLGIGYQGSIPWGKNVHDLQQFKFYTSGNVVIMGRNTFESINFTPLSNRINIVLSKSLGKINENIEKKYYTETNSTLFIVNNIDKVNELIDSYNESKKIFIIGGESLYNYYIDKCYSILLTEINTAPGNTLEFDTFFPEIDDNFILLKTNNYDSYSFLEYVKNPYYYLSHNITHYDRVYKTLVCNILTLGEHRDDRTGTGTVSLFGQQFKINVSKFAPLLTTKEVYWKTAIKELLWMLRGETDSKILEKQGVNIWKGNTSREFLDNRGLNHFPEGELGLGYGHQIRNSGGNHISKTGGVDQLKEIERLLKEDPYSRRIMWNLWVPSDLKDMALVPCHFQIQFYVSKKGFLSLLVTMRSNDIFLGNPFNVFGYYILLRIMALKCNYEPLELIFNLGDAHIYKNHLVQIQEQLSRKFRAQPIVLLNASLKDKDYSEITIDDFSVLGYFPCPSIKGTMAI